MSNPVVRLSYTVLAKILNKKVIFTFHGDFGRFGRFRNLMDRITIRLCDIPITINKKSYEKSYTINKNSKLLSAFLPPLNDGEIPLWVVSQVQRFQRSKKKVFSTNASTLAYTHDGKEIYGIEFLINFFKKRKDDILVISDPSGMYEKKHHGENLFFITSSHSTYALYRYVNGNIRATATDGDSLSVRESLSLGIPTIATDCVDRPEGTILFKYNNEESLKQALEIAEKKNEKIIFQEENSIRKVLKIYKSCI